MCLCGANLSMTFPELFSKRKFVDVTLVCEGRRIHCHRVVLAAYSPYFDEILEENPAQHPVIILPRDVKFWEIDALVKFMYKGEISVSENYLEELLKCAEMFQIRGLQENIQCPNENSQGDDVNVDRNPDPEVIIPNDTANDFIPEIKTESPEDLEIMEVPAGEDDLSPKNFTSAEGFSVNFDDLANPPIAASSSNNSNLPTAVKIRKDHKRRKPFLLKAPLSSKPKKQMLRTVAPSILNLKMEMPTPPDEFQLPRKRKYYYSREMMWAAMMSVHNGKMSIRDASTLYNVPSGSVYTYMKKYGLNTSFLQTKTKMIVNPEGS